MSIEDAWEQLKERPISDKIFNVIYDSNKDDLESCAEKLGLDADDFKSLLRQEYFIPGMTFEMAAESAKMLMTSIIDLGYKYPTPTAAIRNGIEYASISITLPKKDGDLYCVSTD